MNRHDNLFWLAQEEAVSDEDIFLPEGTPPGPSPAKTRVSRKKRGRLLRRLITHYAIEIIKASDIVSSHVDQRFLPPPMDSILFQTFEGFQVLADHSDDLRELLSICAEVIRTKRSRQKSQHWEMDRDELALQRKANQRDYAEASMRMYKEILDKIEVELHKDLDFAFTLSEHMPPSKSTAHPSPACPPPSSHSLGIPVPATRVPIDNVSTFQPIPSTSVKDTHPPSPQPSSSLQPKLKRSRTQTDEAISSSSPSHSQSPSISSSIQRKESTPVAKKKKTDNTTGKQPMAQKATQHKAVASTANHPVAASGIPEVLATSMPPFVPPKINKKDGEILDFVARNGTLEVANIDGTRSLVVKRRKRVLAVLGSLQEFHNALAGKSSSITTQKIVKAKYFVRGEPNGTYTILGPVKMIERKLWPDNVQ